MSLDRLLLAYRFGAISPEFLDLDVDSVRRQIPRLRPQLCDTSLSISWWYWYLHCKVSSAATPGARAPCYRVILAYEDS